MHVITLLEHCNPDPDLQVPKSQTVYRLCQQNASLREPAVTTRPFLNDV